MTPSIQLEKKIRIQVAYDTKHPITSHLEFYKSQSMNYNYENAMKFQEKKKFR